MLFKIVVIVFFTVVYAVLFVIASRQSQQLDVLSDKYFDATERLEMTQQAFQAMMKDRNKWKQMYLESERVRKQLCEERNENANEQTENG